ncbi:MAG: nitrogenase component 1, partial [Methanothrix sp.]|nr:nitrogenase component 1 [Methanothrix sp.]
MDGGRFFGAFRAFSGITDAVVLSHSPVGCNWGTGIFNNFSNQPDIRHACTVVHEREIVFGGEEALKKALALADEIYDRSLLVVISGDVPSIIGDDVQAVIDSVSSDEDVLWLEAAGYSGSMRDGYEDALLKLGSLMKERGVVERSVNLIGFCPDDFKVHADIKEITRIMEDLGVKLNCTLSICSFEELRAAPAA